MREYTIPSQGEIETAIGPLDKYSHQCHAASLALVRSGVLPGEDWRVARGWARGLTSQHSWAVQGDPYDHKSMIVDITLWSFQKHIPRVFVTQTGISHEPHGYSHLIPKVVVIPSKPLVTDLPLEKLSDDTIAWLQLRYPNGIGWTDVAQLCSGPMLGWPARDLVSAVADSRYRALIPIDVIGMMTDENPGELYW